MSAPNEHDEPTLRDIFALVAMHAMVTEPRPTGKNELNTVAAIIGPQEASGMHPSVGLSHAAYRITDSMLAARERDK